MKAKKIILMLALFAGSYTAAYSQGFTLGVKAGHLRTTMPTNFPGIFSRRPQSGYQIGLFARIGNKTFIQPELNYEATSGVIGYDFNTNGTNFTGFSDLKYRRMDIPILFGHKFVSLPLFNFRGYIGPDFGLKINGSTLTTPILTYEFYRYKAYDVGAVIGAGIDIANLTFDARYNFGLTQVNQGFNARLNTFGIAVGFKFL